MLQFVLLKFSYIAIIKTGMRKAYKNIYSRYCLMLQEDCGSSSFIGRKRYKIDWFFYTNSLRLKFMT